MYYIMNNATENEMTKLTRADYGGADVRWTADKCHAVRRIGRDAWQIREVRDDGSPFGDLLNVVPTLTRAQQWLRDTLGY